jgi:hypothetical protein
MQVTSIEERLEKLLSNYIDAEGAKTVPLYRFLVIPGHEF